MEEKKTMCDGCSVYKYCGTMVSSVRLCRSIHKNKKDGEYKSKPDQRNH